MKISNEDLQKLIESLYKNTDKELKTILKSQLTIRGKILNEVANIMLIYSIENDIMSMSKTEQRKEMEKLLIITKMYVKSGAETQISIISDLLTSTVKKELEFFNYNPKGKDIEKIVKEHYKGKHFSSRVWENEKELAKAINKHLDQFVKGKVSVNDIKKIITTDFNNGAYNTKRLVNTEVARVQDRAFNKFGEAVGIKYVRYNAELDSKTCDDCSQYDGKVFRFDKKIELPRHPLCRCYYEIVEDEYNDKVIENFINDSYYEK